MLILTRRQGETICINRREINITVLGIKGGQVRIGIDAPDDMPVHREEIELKIERDGLRATLTEDNHD